MPKHTIYIWLVFVFLFLELAKCGIPGLHKWVISNFPSCVKIVDRNKLVDWHCIEKLKKKKEKYKKNHDNKDGDNNYGDNKDGDNKDGDNKDGDNKDGDNKYGDNNYGDNMNNTYNKYNIRDDKDKSFCKEEKIFEVDNLLFDLNQLLHKANVKFINYDNYFLKLTRLIKNVLKKFEPKKNVVFAIDGICPFSKLKLQIKRRAKSKLKNKENHLVNDITCGSIFINKISKFLVNFLKHLLSFEKYENVRFFISTDQEVGEGELKLMNWIVNYVSNEKKNKNIQIKTDKQIREDTKIGNVIEIKKDNIMKHADSKQETFNEIKNDNFKYEGNKKFMSNNKMNNSTNYETLNVEEESFVIVGADADLLLQCLSLKNVHNIFIYTYQMFDVEINDNNMKKENYLIENKVMKDDHSFNGDRNEVCKMDMNYIKYEDDITCDNIKNITYENNENNNINININNNNNNNNNVCRMGDEKHIEKIPLKTQPIDGHNVKKKKIKVLYNLKTFINLFLKKYPNWFHKIKADLLILFILKGNDYLPKIKEGNFGIFFEAYFKMLENKKNMINCKEREYIYNNNNNSNTYEGLLNSNTYKINKKEFLLFLNEIQKIVNFTNIYNNNNNNNNIHYYDSNSKSFIQYDNKFYMKQYNTYSPLLLLNELTSKKILDKDTFTINASKNENDMFECNLIYFKNNKKYIYSSQSKKKKNAMHLSSYDFLNEHFPHLMKYIDKDYFEKNIKQSDNNIEILNNNECNINKIEHIQNVENNNNSKCHDVNNLKKKKNLKCYDENYNNIDMENYIKNFYLQHCQDEKIYKEEMDIVENYIEGIHWLVEMYNKTYCINFNFFYKYMISPSLLSLYYYLSTNREDTYNNIKSMDHYNNYKNKYMDIIQKINLNIFKSNLEYYDFINFCVDKYNNLKMNIKKMSTCGNKDTSYNDEEKIEHTDDMKYEKRFSYFKNIYNILFSNNLIIIKDSIKKLNDVLKSQVYNKRIINYYWNVYTKKRLKKFYKIIFFKAGKMFVSKFSLFNLNFEQLKKKQDNQNYSNDTNYEQRHQKLQQNEEDNPYNKMVIRNNFLHSIFNNNKSIKTNRKFTTNSFTPSDDKSKVIKGCFKRKSIRWKYQ
ncbi:hypothetical protein PGSY75_0204600 [Plasmodium gaboni]|uniref:Xrn1 N-terminal domain-containing protein n=1 Tax=Plasmodium gaboni TaxID=647221 RepID=A0A151LWA9_9APIC|nr:hypothetical protein PGSY75_0204600 [Plasmodium gaboni]KYO03479.1 hypothetical protein PGSY75_0204600 [Plasmodium gaboni]